MAIAVLGGLSVSTVLSLLVVPAFYVVADRLKARLGRALGRSAKPAKDEASPRGGVTPVPPSRGSRGNSPLLHHPRPRSRPSAEWSISGC